MSIERATIVGAGAMGSMYAAHLADAGLDVSVFATGDRAERLRRGLRVNGRDYHLDVTTPGAARPADLVLVAVKDRQLDQALSDAASTIGQGTVVLSVMNGLDSEERIRARFPQALVPLCIALAMDAQADADGVRYRQAGRLAFGWEDGRVDAPLLAIQEVLDRAGLAWECPPDMPHRMWWKFMVNTGVNQASAVLRRPYGAFQVPGPARDLMWALTDEVVAVSRAEGVPLTEDDQQTWDAVLAGQPAEGWTSMHQDVEAGRPTEVESFAGRVVELGRRHGIPTPYNQAVLWILRDVAG